MGCLIVLLAFLSPRFILVLLWLFGDRLSIAFGSFFQGLVGFVFLPYATMFYALAYRPGTGVSSLGWVFVALGVVLDISSWSGGGRHARNRSQQA